MPADDAPLAEIDNNDHYAVHEYKKCMGDIKRDNPNLATGAIQKMALERCGAMIHEEEQHRGRNNKKLFAEPAADLLRGMMSKLRLGGKGNNRTKSVSVAAVEEDELAGTIGSSTDKPNEEFVVRRGRSIAARKSVACSISSEEREAVAQLSGDKSDSEEDDEESLSHSLQNIEKQQFSPEKRRSRRSLVDSKRGSTRASEISLSLSDVEEDVETKPSNKGVIPLDLSSSTSKGGERRQASLRKEESVTKLLPDEIKVLLNNFGAVATDKNNHENSSTSTANQHQGGKVQKKVQSNDERSSNNSSYAKLSVLSVDSDTFGGDFSAWASARRLSNCSSTT